MRGLLALLLAMLVIGGAAVPPVGAQDEVRRDPAFSDAILRTLAAAEIAGVGAILAHAISERAKQFYLGFGFTPSDFEPMTLMITLAEAQAEPARKA